VQWSAFVPRQSRRVTTSEHSPPVPAQSGTLPRAHRVIMIGGIEPALGWLPPARVRPTSTNAVRVIRTFFTFTRTLPRGPSLSAIGEEGGGTGQDHCLGDFRQGQLAASAAAKDGTPGVASNGTPITVRVGRAGAGADKMQCHCVPLARGLVPRGPGNSRGV